MVPFSDWLHLSAEELKATAVDGLLGKPTRLKCFLQRL
jgi:hypothetical protein